MTDYYAAHYMTSKRLREFDRQAVEREVQRRIAEIQRPRTDQSTAVCPSPAVGTGRGHP